MDRSKRLEEIDVRLAQLRVDRLQIDREWDALQSERRLLLGMSSRQNHLEEMADAIERGYRQKR